MISRFSQVFLSASVLLLSSLQPVWAGEVLEEELENGMRIVVMENPASPTVSVNIFISAGSLDETPETTGLAHFYEHMFFRGTPRLSGLDFKKSIEDIGGSTNATTAKDMTHYFIALPSEYAARGLSLLADALMRANLDQKGIDIERDVVLEEYRISENNPGRIATEKLYKMAYGEHAYGMSTIGTKERINAYQRIDFVKWRNRQYGPQRCTVVVVGDINGEKMLKRAKRLFKSFRGTEQQDRKLIEPPAPPEKPVYEEGYGPVGSAMILLGYPSPSAHDQPDVYAVDVLSFLLGQGTESLLHRHVVKDQEIARSASVNFLTPRQRGLIIVSAAGSAKKSAKIKAAILAEIEAVKEGKFEDKDLLRAKAHLSQSYVMGNETNSGKADTVGFYAALGVPGFWKTYDAEVKKVTREDVIAAAKKYLGPSHWGYTLKPSRGRR